MLFNSACVKNYKLLMFIADTTYVKTGSEKYILLDDKTVTTDMKANRTISVRPVNISHGSGYITVHFILFRSQSF